MGDDIADVVTSAYTWRLLGIPLDLALHPDREIDLGVLMCYAGLSTWAVGVHALLSVSARIFWNSLISLPIDLLGCCHPCMRIWVVGCCSDAIRWVYMVQILSSVGLQNFYGVGLPCI